MSSASYFGKTSRLKPLSPRKAMMVSALDIGSSKIVCIIARLTPDQSVGDHPHRSHTVEVVGFGQHRALGVKNGAIVDLDAAEQSIRMTVDAAERMSGLTVESVIVNLSAGRMMSESYAASVAIGGHEVEDADIHRVLKVGAAQSISEGRNVIHALPIAYALDHTAGILDPRGMVGGELGVDMHVVTAETAAYRNVIICVERCHLHVDAVVASPYAAALSALVADEMELGAAVIDMGGGTTSLAVMRHGRFVHADVIPVGGNHVTNDIAQVLSTPLGYAERLKTLHGSPLPCPSDDRELLSFPHTGEDDEAAGQISRAQLVAIIRPRIEETLELVRERLIASGHYQTAGRCIVLTGGASELSGLTEVARRIFGKQIRIGRPLGIDSLPETARRPCFSVVAGLAIYPQVARIEQFDSRRSRSLQTGTGGYFARMGAWFRDSF